MIHHERTTCDVSLSFIFLRIVELLQKFFSLCYGRECKIDVDVCELLLNSPSSRVESLSSETRIRQTLLWNGGSLAVPVTGYLLAAEPCGLD